jgi:hypothetical protein
VFNFGKSGSIPSFPVGKIDKRQKGWPDAQAGTIQGRRRGRHDGPFGQRSPALRFQPRQHGANGVAPPSGFGLSRMGTDAAGGGTVTVQDTIRPGTTGVWVIIERPNGISQNPAEFYTSEFVAPV